MKFRNFVGAVAVAGALLLGSTPVSAGGESVLAITGEAACLLGAPEATVSIEWNIENLTNDTVVINSAELSGAATGSVTVSPTNLLPFETGTATTSMPAPNELVSVTLTVDYTWINGEFPLDGTVSGTVRFDLECAPAPTTTSTTTTTAVPAQVVQPRFAG
jgi:hypothetical protein